MEMNPWTPEQNVLFLRRLGKTVEELGELVAVLGRSICQGVAGVDPVTGEGNIERMEKESADVIAQISCNVEAFQLDHSAMTGRAIAKTVQMGEWESHFEDEGPKA